VLLPRFSQAYDALPGLAFNHAISQVLLDGQTVWVDTTDDTCRFGLLPPGDPGRNVLVIDGTTSALTQLPQPQARDHELRLEGKVNCRIPAEPLEVSLRVHTRGYPDYEFRTVAREINAHGATLPLLSTKLQPIAGTFAMEHQTTTRVSALDEEFSSQVDWTWIGGAARNTGKWLLHAPFWIPKEWQVALRRRTSPLFLNDGYPLTLDQEFEFTLPPKAELESLPGVSQNRAGPLQWRAEWAKLGHDKLSAKFHAELPRGELSLAETVELQKQLRELLAALNIVITISVPP
jgi:hypothetical protein